MTNLRPIRWIGWNFSNGFWLQSNRKKFHFSHFVEVILEWHKFAHWKMQTTSPQARDAIQTHKLRYFIAHSFFPCSIRLSSVFGHYSNREGIIIICWNEQRTFTSDEHIYMNIAVSFHTRTHPSDENVIWIMVGPLLKLTVECSSCVRECHIFYCSKTESTHQSTRWNIVNKCTHSQYLYEVIMQR